MRDLTLFLAFIVAVLLAYQAKPNSKLPTSRTAKVTLNDGLHFHARHTGGGNGAACLTSTVFDDIECADCDRALIALSV